DVTDPSDSNDPTNYVRYYSKTDYTQNSDLRAAIQDINGYPTDDNYTDPNNYVAKVIANQKKIGPGITLKVMAGDKINIRVSSWYNLDSHSPTDNNEQDLIISDLVNS